MNTYADQEYMSRRIRTYEAQPLAWSLIVVWGAILAGVVGFWYTVWHCVV